VKGFRLRLSDFHIRHAFNTTMTGQNGGQGFNVQGELTLPLSAKIIRGAVHDKLLPF